MFSLLPFTLHAIVLEASFMDMTKINECFFSRKPLMTGVALSWAGHITNVAKIDGRYKS